MDVSSTAGVAGKAAGLVALPNIEFVASAPGFAGASLVAGGLFETAGVLVEAVEFESEDGVCAFSAARLSFFLSLLFTVAVSFDGSARRSFLVSAGGLVSVDDAALGSPFFGAGASPVSIAFSSEAGPTRTPST